MGCITEDTEEHLDRQFIQFIQADSRFRKADRQTRISSSSQASFASSSSAAAPSHVV